MKNELIDYCLRIGDSSLILSHRIAEYCSKAPILEEDLAITKHKVDTILKSPTWLAVIDGFETGNTPPECHRACGPGSYTSTTQTAKHSDYTGDKN